MPASEQTPNDQDPRLERLKRLTTLRRRRAARDTWTALEAHAPEIEEALEAPAPPAATAVAPEPPEREPTLPEMVERARKEYPTEAARAQPIRPTVPPPEPSDAVRVEMSGVEVARPEPEPAATVRATPREEEPIIEMAAGQERAREEALAGPAVVTGTDIKLPISGRQLVTYRELIRYPAQTAGGLVGGAIMAPIPVPGARFVGFMAGAAAVGATQRPGSEFEREVTERAREDFPKIGPFALPYVAGTLASMPLVLPTTRSAGLALLRYARTNPAGRLTGGQAQALERVAQTALRGAELPRGLAPGKTIGERLARTYGEEALAFLPFDVATAVGDIAAGRPLEGTTNLFLGPTVGGAFGTGIRGLGALRGARAGAAVAEAVAPEQAVGRRAEPTRPTITEPAPRPAVEPEVPVEAVSREAQEAADYLDRFNQEPYEIHAQRAGGKYEVIRVSDKPRRYAVAYRDAEGALISVDEVGNLREARNFIKEEGGQLEKIKTRVAKDAAAYSDEELQAKRLREMANVQFARAQEVGRLMDVPAGRPKYVSEAGGTGIQGAVGTGAGWQARGRMTQAHERLRLLEVEAERRGLPGIDEDEITIEAAARVLKDDEFDLRAASADELTAKREELESFLTENPTDAQAGMAWNGIETRLDRMIDEIAEEFVPLAWSPQQARRYLFDRPHTEPLDVTVQRLEQTWPQIRRAAQEEIGEGWETATLTGRQRDIQELALETELELLRVKEAAETPRMTELRRRLERVRGEGAEAPPAEGQVDMFGEGEVAPLRSRASEMLPDVITPAMAERPETIGMLPGRTQTVIEMERVLQRPIVTGRMRSRAGALGEYHVRPEVVRTKFAKDIEVVAHEVGHHLHKLFFGLTPKGRLTSKPLQPWRAELWGLAEELGVPKGKRTMEGFAEFWRRYLTNPDAAKAKAPDFYAFAEGRLLTEFPEIHAMLKKARDDYRLWVEADPQARVRAQVATQDPPEAWSAANPWQRFVTNVFDDQAVYKRLVNDLLGGKIDKIELDVPLLARLTRGAPGTGDTFVFHGTLDFETLQVRGKPFAKIIEPLGERLDDFRDYAVARRAQLDLHPRGIETGIRPEDARAVYERFEGDEAFNQAFEEIQTYGRELLEYLRDAGVISNESFRRILELNPNWVPFYRLRERAGRGGKPSIRRGGANQFGHLFSPVKRMKGSTAEIIDPLEGIIKNTYLYTHLVARQQVSMGLARLANVHGAGRWIREVPAPMRPTKVSVQEMVDLFAGKLKKLDPDMADAVGQALTGLVESAPGLADELLMVWRPGDYFGKENVISVLLGGKRRWYEVEPDLYAALMGLDRETTSALVRYLAFPARMLRAGATTFSLEFAARNPWRDAIQAFVWSEYGFKPGIDNARGLFHLLGQTDTYWKWKAAGGEWAALVDMDRTHLRAQLRGQRVQNVVKSPLDALATLSALMENSTRMGEFARGVRVEEPTKAGLQYAAGAGRESGVDFARHGAKTASIRMVSAFWNARLQGYARMARAFREHPVRTSARAFTGITIPSLLLYYVNRDDPEYWEIPQWQRDLFWCVKVNGTWLRVPKPFEIGLVFGSIPERILEWADTQNPAGVRRSLEETLRREIWTTFVPLPTAATPLVESFANYNIFMERKIVPERLKDVEPRYQAREYSTDVARGIGDMLDVSPAKIDNVLQGWTGGFGRMVTEGVGAAGRAVGALPERERPATRPRDWPVVRAFTVKFPPSSSESESRFWEEYARTAEVKGTVDYLKREQHENYEPYVNEHMEDLERYQELQETADVMRQLIAQQRFIFRAPHMNEEQKRDAIEQIQRMRILLARQAIDRETPGGEIGDLQQLSRQFAEQFNELMRGAPLQERQ